MKRAAIALSLLAGLVIPVTAGATAPPRPAQTTLYMHGKGAIGEQDGAAWVASQFQDSALTLSPAKPAGDGRSMSYAGLVNDVCTGVPLYPTFAGKLQGTIVGPLRLTLTSVAAPGTFTARVWTDTSIFQCNADYVPPAAEVRFDLPAGQSKVTVTLPALPRRDRVVDTGVVVMVFAPTIPAYRGQAGRLQYDGAAAPSALSFACIPRKGRSTCA